MSNPGQFTPVARRRLVWPAAVFAVACAVPYASLTLIGPATVVAAFVFFTRRPGETWPGHVQRAGLGSFLGCGLYTLLAEVVYGLGRVNIQAAETARIVRLLGLPIRVEPDRPPMSFVGLEWLGGAVFYGVVAAMMVYALSQRFAAPPPVTV